MLVHFRNFTRDNVQRLPATQGVSGQYFQFKSHCVVLIEDKGIPYDMSLSCRRRDFVPEAFSLTSKNDHVVLQLDKNGKPVQVIFTGFDKSHKAKYKVELELDLDENVKGLKFYLPPDGISVNNVDELTQFHQVVNDINGSEAATGEEINEALKANLLLKEAFTSAEFHLELSLGLLSESLKRAKGLK